MPVTCVPYPACTSDASSSIPSSSSNSVPPSPKWRKYFEPKNMFNVEDGNCNMSPYADVQLAPRKPLAVPLQN
ncbi:hypothetical protein E4U56_007019, partial [Claviceps arundinis]